MTLGAMLRHTKQMKHTEGPQPLPLQLSYSKGAAGTSKGPQHRPVPELLPGLDVPAKHQEFHCLDSAAPQRSPPTRALRHSWHHGSPVLGVSVPPWHRNSRLLLLSPAELAPWPCRAPLGAGALPRAPQLLPHREKLQLRMGRSTVPSPGARLACTLCAEPLRLVCDCPGSHLVR